MSLDNLDAMPVSPNPDQKNMDQLSATINDRVKKAMGALEDTGPEGRNFLDNKHSLFGYDGVVVSGGEIVSLVNLDKDENVPTISLNTEVAIEGDSRDYVSSGHKPGDRVKVIGFIEPFFKAGKGIQSSDRIIQVEGSGIIGWIKPSEFDKVALIDENKASVVEVSEKLFRKPD